MTDWITLRARDVTPGMVYLDDGYPADVVAVQHLHGLVRLIFSNTPCDCVSFTPDAAVAVVPGVVLV
jgi:hypothetical protein